MNDINSRLTLGVKKQQKKEAVEQRVSVTTAGHIMST